MARVYLASSLKNWRKVRSVRDELATHGIEITHDWTIWGEEIENGVSDLSSKALSEKAQLELDGVLSADAIVAIMPGERGTHFELGVAYYRAYCSGRNANIFILCEEEPKVPTSFHYLPGVIRHTDLTMLLYDLKSTIC